jgi:hypothetical protein
MTNAPESGDALLRPNIIEDFADDDFGIIREPGGPRVEIAIAHDGSTDGVLEAERAAAAIMALPALRDVLREATNAWGDAFNGDGHVSGADLLDWFAQWRLRAQAAIQELDTGRASSAIRDGGDGA